MRSHILFAILTALFAALSSCVAHAQWVPDGRSLCSAASPQDSPSLVQDGAGGAIVVWRDERNSLATGPDIYAIGVTRAGAFFAQWPTDGVPLCTATDLQESPKAVADGLGGAIAVWNDYRTDSFGDLYATKIQYNGMVAPSWPVNGLAVCTAARQQLGHVVASDNAGGAFVAWSDLRNLSHFDIFIQHVLANGAVDPAWPADGLAICTAADNQRSPAIAADGNGGAIVAWRDDRNFATSNSDIYAQRVNNSGTVLWTANGVIVCDTTGLQQNPTLIGDGGGGALIAWTDLRSGATGRDIFAHHLTSTGVRDASWPLKGGRYVRSGRIRIFPLS